MLASAPRMHTEDKVVASILGITEASIRMRLNAMEIGSVERSDLLAILPHLMIELPVFVDRLYDRFSREPELADFIQDEARLARLKAKQQQYVRELYSREIDHDYVMARIRLGVVHHQLKVSPPWYIATYSHFLRDHTRLVLSNSPTIATGVERLITLTKCALFDASLALQAYGYTEENAIWTTLHPETQSAGVHEAHSPSEATVSAAPMPRQMLRLRLDDEVVNRRRRFLELSEEDIEVLRALEPCLTEAAPAVLNHFYDWLSTIPDAAKLVSAEMAVHLKRQVATYWRELATGDYDRSYASSRMRIGIMHQRIGLHPHWYIASLSQQLARFMRAIAAQPDPASKLEALIKAVFFDMTFVMDAYMDARVEALLRTEGYANQLVAGLTSAVAVLDEHHRIVSANKAFVELIGGDASVIYLLNVLEALPRVEVSQLLERLKFEGGGRYQSKIRIGSRQYNCTALDLGAAGGKAESVTALIFDDISELMHVADMADRDAASLDAIARSTVAALWEMEAATGNVTAMSSGIEGIVGRSAATFLGSDASLRNAVADEDKCRFIGSCEELPPGGHLIIEHRMLHRSGRQIWARTLLSRPAAQSQSAVIHGITHDITELREATARRLESLALVAGGVAHVVNNAMAVILGGIELHLSANKGTRAPMLELAARAAHHTVATTKQLLAFAGRRRYEFVIANINDRILATQDDLNANLGPGIELRVEISRSLWNCKYEELGFDRSLNALITNAREAIPSNGIVVIGTRNVAATGDAGGATFTDWVELFVSDNGCGMPEATRERALEPFYTTKSLAEAHGLGLSQVHGYAMQCGGMVLIESEAGSGTTVRVRFPRVSASTDQPAGFPEASGVGSS